MTVTWNPSDKLGTTLSGGNLTATSSGLGVGRATVGYSTGDISFKVTFTTGGGGTGFGFISASLSIAAVNAGAAYIGDDLQGVTMFDDGVVYFNGTLVSLIAPSPGDLVEVRLRILTSSTAGFYRRINGGNWNDNPSANPATDTGAVSITGLTGFPWYPAFEVDANGGAITADFTALNGYTGTIATNLAITSAITAAHGVSGTVGPTLGLTMAASGTFTPSGYTGTIGATLTIASAITAKHGVSGTSAVTLTVASAITATHGVSGTIGSTLALTMSASGTASAPIATVTGTIGIVLGFTASLTGSAGYRWTPVSPDTTVWTAVRQPANNPWAPVSADVSVWTPIPRATP